MTFVSYAQNFEDVMLWRALKLVRAGTYVDVGAGHPDIDSVTRAFYDRGWQGINIEPVTAEFRRLLAARPRDVNLDVALGERPGSADFYVFAGTGLSTQRREEAREIESRGFPARRITINVETLADICARHTSGDIHFLKIDVEGAERQVLAGADFVRFRPWIVLVEATAPMSTTPSHAEWEPLLTAAHYRFVWFDGLNRFYVAAEHCDELAPSFQAPPNVFDDFLRAADTEWARRIAQAEAVAVREAARADASTAQAEGLARALADEQVARIRTQFASDLRTLDNRELLAHHAEKARLMKIRALEAEDWLRSMRASTSWKVTGPLRRSMRLVARLRGRRPAAEQQPMATPAQESPDGLPAAVPRVPVPVAVPVPVPVPQDRPRRVVHQFHSGSAVGDAITNAMLLTRGLLRAAGYVSDIFVEHRDPLLADELRMIDELPPRTDYVLIVRHSMGYDAFERILELPAAKILLYHNITPPEFLVGMPHAQQYAALGRRQLARLRGKVAAALADSAFNTVELSRLGFEAPVACTLLLDPAVLRAHAGSRKSNDVFTVLFVGRVTPPKAQLDLVLAFDAFRRLVEMPVRLVLVGRHGGEGDPYYDEILRTLRDHDLMDVVILTGLISDQALHEWYDRAALYVSLSHHEGFGVPLVEAMGHGVPVLAWPCGAIPYTLGNVAGILKSREARDVAARMAELASCPERRAALVGVQTRALDRFDLERQGQVLFRALAQAGAAPPRDAALHRDLAGNLRFTVTGHFSGSYSLAAVNRTLALQLEELSPGSVRILPVEGQPTTVISGVPPDLQKTLDAMVARTPPPTGPEVVISQHYPVHVPLLRGDVTLALFFWEESLVPRETVDLLNQHFDGIVAASRFTATALRNSGVRLPVEVIGHAPLLAPFSRLAGTCGSAPGEPFTFLHVSSGFPRKGLDLLLAAYASSFRREDPVRLMIKTFGNPHNGIAAQVARLTADDADAPDIVSIESDIDLSELLALYRSADAVVLPTRGEGFNLPAAEAMAAGIPLVVTGFGGHMAFCGPDTARLLDYRFAASRSHLATPGSVWVEPDADDLAQAMREAVTKNAAVAARAQRAATAITRLLAPEAMRERLAKVAIDVLRRPPARPIRIAWVSTWEVRCGIAEYSRHLLDALAEVSPADTMSVLADERAAPAPTDLRPVLSAWRRVDIASVPSLAAAIAEEGPDAVVIQHQPGLFSWPTLAALVELPALRSLAAIVTLHNTRELLDRNGEERAWVVASLSRIARVAVHTVADLNRLKQLGLVENVVLIPHGVPPFRPPVPARVVSPGKPVLIGCYGFFLPKKGIPQLIEALALLRTHRPGATLRLVNAEYDAADSQAEIAACRAAAAKAGVADAIEWITEFLPTERSVGLLGECDLVVLPYQSSKEASSAAVRTALSAGVCVAVTPLALFDDAGAAVVRLEDTSPQALASGIEALLGDAARRRDAQHAAQAWLKERAWSLVASRMAGMLHGLVHDMRPG